MRPARDCSVPWLPPKRLCPRQLGRMLPWANLNRDVVKIPTSRRSAHCLTSSVYPSCTAESVA